MASPVVCLKHTTAVLLSSLNSLTDLSGSSRLTGLLSFMLSDEMTTGSVTSTDAHKRAFAARSHAWNVANPRFKEAFPDVRLPLLYTMHSALTI